MWLYAAAAGVVLALTAAAVPVAQKYSAPKPQTADGTFAIYAYGQAAFVGLDGLTISGNLLVRINNSGKAVTNTICPYCGLGCELEVHVQDNAIVKVTSPLDQDITNGHLCIKGRFGFQYVQRRKKDRT